VTGDGLVHTWWTTDKDLRFGRWRWQVFLQEVLGDVTRDTVPFVAGLVNKVVDGDLVLVFSGNFIQFWFQDNVFFSLGTVEQRNLGLVDWVLGDFVDQLVQWGDTRTTTNQGDGFKLVWFPFPFDNWTLEGQSVIWDQVVDVARHFPGFVFFDDKFNGTFLVHVGNWGVWSDDVVTFGGDEFGQQQRGGGQSRNLVLGWQFENEVFGVVGDVG